MKDIGNYDQIHDQEGRSLYGSSLPTAEAKTGRAIRLVSKPSGSPVVSLRDRLRTLQAHGYVL